MSFHVYLNKPQGLWRKEDMAIYTNTNPHFLRYVKRAERAAKAAVRHWKELTNE